MRRLSGVGPARSVIKYTDVGEDSFRDPVSLISQSDAVFVRIPTVSPRSRIAFQGDRSIPWNLTSSLPESIRVPEHQRTNSLTATEGIYPRRHSGMLVGNSVKI